MVSVRSVRLWGSLTVLALAAAAIILAHVGQEPLTGASRVEELLVRVHRLTHNAQSTRDPAPMLQAELLLTAALREEEPGSDRLWAALGQVQLSRAELKHKAMEDGRWHGPASIRRTFQKALDINPKNVRALLGLSKYHELRDDYWAALAADEKLLAFEPLNQPAMEHRGRCLMKLGQYARAEQALKQLLLRVRLLKNKQAEIFAMELLGQAYLRQRKYRLAEQVLLEAVEAAEATKVAACPYAALGELYTLTGRQEEVVRLDMRAADMEPKVPEMQYSAAKTCHEHDHHTEALWYIQRALKLDPDQAAYKKLRDQIQGKVKVREPATELADALAHLHGHGYRRARIHVDWALAAGAGPTAQVVKGFLLLLEKKYRDARALFTAASKADPTDAGPRVGLGHLAIVRKDYAAARRLLEPEAPKARGEEVGHGPLTAEAKKRYPWLVSRMASLGMGWLLSNQNEHEAALAHFDRVLAGDPDDTFALLGKGNSLNALGRLDRAQRLLERVLELDPKNRYATAELALVTLNRGKVADAERLFKAALRQPGGAHYTCPHEGLGMVYLRAGKLDRAKASFRKAIEINPDIEYKKFNGLARILIREGKYASARRLLRKSIQNYPYDNEARKLLAAIKDR